MARPVYTIQDNDYSDAWSYINQKLTDDQWPSPKAHDVAYRSFHKLHEDSLKLNTWAERHLNTDQWTSLKNAVRSRRKRSLKVGEIKNVSLTIEAWERLKTVSEREGIAHSEVILKHLKLK